MARGPMSSQPKPVVAGPRGNKILGTKEGGMELEGEKADSAPHARSLGRNSPSSPATIPGLDSPPFSAQVLSLPSLASQLPEPASPFGRNCVQSQAPVITARPMKGFIGTGFASHVH